MRIDAPYISAETTGIKFRCHFGGKGGNFMYGETNWTRVSPKERDAKDRERVIAETPTPFMN